MADMINELQGAFYRKMKADKRMRVSGSPDHVALYMWLSVRRYESQQEVITLAYEPTRELAYLNPASMASAADDLERWGILEVLTKADTEQTAAKVRFAPAYLNQFGIPLLPQSPRKQFRHPSEPLQDKRIANLYKKHGYEGLGLLCTILERLTINEKPLDTSYLKSLLKVTKRLERVWSSLEELGLITAVDGQTDSPLTRERWRPVR